MEFQTQKQIEQQAAAARALVFGLIDGRHFDIPKARLAVYEAVSALEVLRADYAKLRLEDQQLLPAVLWSRLDPLLRLFDTIADPAVPCLTAQNLRSAAAAFDAIHTVDFSNPEHSPEFNRILARLSSLFGRLTDELQVEYQYLLVVDLSEVVDALESQDSSAVGQAILRQVDAAHHARAIAACAVMARLRFVDIQLRLNNGGNEAA